MHQEIKFQVTYVPRSRLIAAFKIKYLSWLFTPKGMSCTFLTPSHDKRSRLETFSELPLRSWSNKQYITSVPTSTDSFPRFHGAIFFARTRFRGCFILLLELPHIYSYKSVQYFCWVPKTHTISVMTYHHSDLDFMFDTSPLTTRSMKRRRKGSTLKVIPVACSFQRKSNREVVSDWAPWMMTANRRTNTTATVMHTLSVSPFSSPGHLI